MKKIILILFLLIEIFVNEFTLTQLSNDKSLGIDVIIKIRLFKNSESFFPKIDKIDITIE